MNTYNGNQIWTEENADATPGSRYGHPPFAPVRLSYQVVNSEDGAGDIFRRDAATLAEMLRPVHLPPNAPLAEQIFGNQVRQQRLSLEHILNLINERTLLHKRIVEDIARSHMDVQGQLYGARLHAKMDDHARELKVERLLFQLDEQRRREDLQFWADTAELREKLFETSGAYQTLRHRTSVFEGLEPQENSHA